MPAPTADGVAGRLQVTQLLGEGEQQQVAECVAPQLPVVEPPPGGPAPQTSPCAPAWRWSLAARAARQRRDVAERGTSHDSRSRPVEPPSSAVDTATCRHRPGPVAQRPERDGCRPYPPPMATMRGPRYALAPVTKRRHGGRPSARNHACARDPRRPGDARPSGAGRRCSRTPPRGTDLPSAHVGREEQLQQSSGR